MWTSRDAQYLKQSYKGQRIVLVTDELLDLRASEATLLGRHSSACNDLLDGDKQA
jgi:hypothetical protein